MADSEMKAQSLHTIFRTILGKVKLWNMLNVNRLRAYLPQRKQNSPKVNWNDRREPKYCAPFRLRLNRFILFKTFFNASHCIESTRPETSRLRRMILQLNLNHPPHASMSQRRWYQRGGWFAAKPQSPSLCRRHRYRTYRGGWFAADIQSPSFRISFHALSWGGFWADTLSWSSSVTSGARPRSGGWSGDNIQSSSYPLLSPTSWGWLGSHLPSPSHRIVT